MHLSKNQTKCSSYRCSQVFGSNEISQVQDQDVISCLKYDSTGNYLCLGDKAGRIIIFANTIANTNANHYENTNNQLQATEDYQSAKNISKLDYRSSKLKYDYFTQFQSHMPQFDTLNSTDINEEIVGISWLRPQGKYLKLLTTNNKSMKFWKAFEKTEKRIIKSATKQLQFPRLQTRQSGFIAKQHFIFPSIHPTSINSISHSNNEQYLLSTDKQQSFLWSLQKPVSPYIAHSISHRVKEADQTTSRLSLTCSNMHPKCDSIFVYGMNKCQLGVCDVRMSGKKNKVVDFGVESRSMKNFFSDMIASVTSVEFMQNCKYIISREYLNIKIWDITNPKKPMYNICIQQELKSNLVNLFENNNVYDKFMIRSSADSSTILTGNYNNNFHLINLNVEKQIYQQKQNINPCNFSTNKSGKNIKANSHPYTNMQYELSFEKETIMREIIPGRKGNNMPKQLTLCKQKQNVRNLNTKQKVSVLDFHPSRPEIAVASLNCFFIYEI